MKKSTLAIMTIILSLLQLNALADKIDKNAIKDVKTASPKAKGGPNREGEAPSNFANKKN